MSGRRKDFVAKIIIFRIFSSSSVRETDWSLEVENIFVENGFTCDTCEGKFHVTILEKMQHIRGKPQAVVFEGSDVSRIAEEHQKVISAVNLTLSPPCRFDLFQECLPTATKEGNVSSLEKEGGSTAVGQPPSSSSSTLFECSICGKNFNFASAVEKLRHKKQCQRSTAI